MEQNLAFADVVLDPILQVRECLDETWIVELADLYSGSHTLPPLQVVFDGRRYLLTDGWHRHEAIRRAWGATAVIAVVVVDASHAADPMAVAKMWAAVSNRDAGLRRTDGDKRRAVLLLRSTPDGRKMTHDEIAKRVGVSRSRVTQILSAAEVDVSANIAGNSSVCNGPRGSRVALWSQIDAALRNDPGKPDSHVARDIGCDDTTVRKRRAALGLPKSDSKRWRDDNPREAIAEALRETPDASNAAIAEAVGANAHTVSKVRADLGMEPSRAHGNKYTKGKERTEPPSAPVNPKRADDPREQKVEVIPARPARRADFATNMLQAFERVSHNDRCEAFAAILRRWPELADEHDAQEETVVLQ